MVDPNPRFTSKGGKASYTSPWDSLFMAMLMFAVIAGFAGLVGWNAVVDQGFRDHLRTPTVIIALLSVGCVGAIGGWMLRRGLRWRRARQAHAEATGTPRSILESSKF